MKDFDLEIRFGHGGLMKVTSPQMPGLNLCSKDHAAVWRDIPKAVKGITRKEADERV